LAAAELDRAEQVLPSASYVLARFFSLSGNPNPVLPPRPDDLPRAALRLPSGLLFVCCYSTIRDQPWRVGVAIQHVEKIAKEIFAIFRNKSCQRRSYLMQAQCLPAFLPER